jgi:hypothetical protein
MSGADGFDNLDALRLTPEQVATVKPLKPRRQQRKKHFAGDFYLCPVEWVGKAAVVLGSAVQLLIALQLYRLWRMRKFGEDTIVASNTALEGASFSRHSKRVAIGRLQKAGLLEVVGQHNNGWAPRVRIVGDLS